MRPALYQAIALHARQRVGHGRLLDIDAGEQLLLRQPVLGPELQQNRKLTRRKTQPCRALLQRAGKALGQLAGEIGSRVHSFRSHFFS